MQKIDIVFENINDREVFSTPQGTVTWKDLRENYTETVLKALPKLHEQGIHKVEIGSIAWFHLRRKNSGRFVRLNSMHVARLLK